MVRAVKADPVAGRDEEARHRGLQQGQIDNWAVGEVSARFRGRRLLRAVSYLKVTPTNFYGRPIEGVVALVDMSTEKVLEVTEPAFVPLPPATPGI